MIRACIVALVLLIAVQALPRIDSTLAVVSSACAETGDTEPAGLLAQDQAASTPAADRSIDLDERQRSRFRYMMLGYGLIWLILGAFLVSLNRRIGQVGQEIGELSGRLEDSKRSLPGASN